ncbi:MAG: hypothetical protein RIR18_2059 [Pseudomonadota bacterium]
MLAILSIPASSRWLARPWGDLSPALRSWLHEPGSLTRRCQRQFAELLVQPVLQGRAPSLLDTGHSGCQFSTIREVLLVGDGNPFIFAHSVLTGAKRGPLSCWLSGLGGRSLGTLLFRHPGFRRGKLKYACLDQRSALYRACLAKLPASSFIHQQGPRLWARCCEHRFGRQSIWVAEVFLDKSLYAD